MHQQTSTEVLVYAYCSSCENKRNDDPAGQRESSQRPHSSAPIMQPWNAMDVLVDVGSLSQFTIVDHVAMTAATAALTSST